MRPPRLSASATSNAPKATVYGWKSQGLLKGCCQKVGKHLRFFRDRLVLQLKMKVYINTRNSETNDDDIKKYYESIGNLVRIFQRRMTWYANFQHDGRQCRKSLKTKSKKEARRRALLLEAELIEGSYEQCVIVPSIESVIEQCLKQARTDGRARKTTQKYEGVCRRVLQLANELRRKDILRIDLSFVDEYRYRHVEAGNAPKRSTTKQ